MKKKAHPFLSVTILLFPILLFGGLLLFWYFRTVYYHSGQIRQDDITALSTEDYECLLLFMYPTEPFDPETFSYYRGISTLKANHRFETISDISNYLGAALDTNQQLSNVYIGLDASAISAQYFFHASLYYKEYQKKLLPMISSHPQITFEILLPYYPLNYWEHLSGKRRTELINSYRNFVNIFSEYSNVTIYFLGFEEWLIGNPGNYDASNFCSPDITDFLLALTFRDDYYHLTTDNMEQRFAVLESLAANHATQANPSLSLDLSGYDIIFFGDSVIGNYTNSLSIPGVVQGISGAHAFNMGQGGTSAVMSRDPSIASLNTIVDAFLAKDAGTLDPSKQPYIGLQAYLEYMVSQNANEDTRTCFVIGYGLNDYFCGEMVASEDPLDIYTYKGSLRSAVAKLQKAYPDSMVLLMAPNFCSYFKDGLELRSDVGGQLTDYVDAVLELSEELEVHCLDNYHNLGINATNHGEYLADGCHPNERGRYLIGQHILQAIQNQ